MFPPPFEFRRGKEGKGEKGGRRGRKEGRKRGGRLLTINFLDFYVPP